MITVQEESSSSEVGFSDDAADAAQPQPQPTARPRARPSSPASPSRMETHLESPLESNALGSRRDHPFVYLQPPAPRMDRGWRRPSAPSIFHHIESALSRRLSNTGGPTVTFSPPSSPPSSPPPSSSATLPLPLRQSVFPAAPSSTAPCSAVAVRRPSAVVLLSHASPPRDEERRLMDSPDLLDRDSTTSFMPLQCDEYLKVTPKFDDTITVYLSAMYAKLLVVLGISFPILETIRSDGKYYQGFYLYLYIGTFVFLSFMYGNMLKKRAVVFVVNTYRRKESHPRPSIDSTAMGRLGSNKHYGSFYLRLGAIAFGIGSMVFSGLEFGQFFELTAECRWATQALTPAARMVLTLVQMQFIFLNNREMDMMRHKVAAQFGLMHMIATNLCEWLTVIIEEAKHEIEHLHHSFNGSGGHGGHGVHGGHSAHGHGATGHHRAVRDGHDDAANGTCVTPTDILGTLVRNASPFLFPCTVEYSLICAVVLFEMWKNTHKGGHGHGHSHHSPARDSAVSTQGEVGRPRRALRQPPVRGLHQGAQGPVRGHRRRGAHHHLPRAVLRAQGGRGLRGVRQAGGERVRAQPQHHHHHRRAQRLLRGPVAQVPQQARRPGPGQHAAGDGAGGRVPLQLVLRAGLRRAGHQRPAARHRDHRPDAGHLPDHLRAGLDAAPLLLPARVPPQARPPDGHVPARVQHGHVAGQHAGEVAGQREAPALRLLRQVDLDPHRAHLHAPRHLLPLPLHHLPVRDLEVLLQAQEPLRAQRRGPAQAHRLGAQRHQLTNRHAILPRPPRTPATTFKVHPLFLYFTHFVIGDCTAQLKRIKSSSFFLIRADCSALFAECTALHCIALAAAMQPRTARRRHGANPGNG